MFRYVSWLAFFLLASAPANAAVYVGNLEGYFTNGFASYSPCCAGGGSSVDLEGSPISINFRAETGYADFGGVIDPYVSLQITAVTMLPANVHPRVPGGVSWDYFNFGDVSAFVGNGQAGSISFAATASSNNSVSFDFSYAGADRTYRSISGGGQFGGTFGWSQDAGIGGNFQITRGRVYELGVPEPGTWAMLITGFGVIGASMRRRRARTDYCKIA